MSIKRVVPNIPTNRIDESRAFYTELFGFQVAMDMGWIVTLVSPLAATSQISLLRAEGTVEPSHALTLSIEVEDVDRIYQEALSRKIEVVYPLTDESWGVRRFHVRDPNGVVINVLSHLE